MEITYVNQKKITEEESSGTRQAEPPTLDILVLAPINCFYTSLDPNLSFLHHLYQA